MLGKPTGFKGLVPQFRYGEVDSPAEKDKSRGPFLVILPTFNEAEGIASLLTRITSCCADARVLVVDDLSPDGTADRVRKVMETDDRVHLIVKERRFGYGAACRTGFEWGREKGFDVLVQMDADASHPPETLAALVAAARVTNGVAVGSRYVAGGKVEGWPWFRHLLSRSANTYARFLLGLPVRDATGGFNAWPAARLESMDVGSITSRGYAFLVELKYRAKCLGMSMVEVPIVFRERESGHSKMSSAIMIEGALRVWKMKLSGKYVPPPKKTAKGPPANRVA